MPARDRDGLRTARVTAAAGDVPGNLARAHDAAPEGAVTPVLDALRDLLGVTATPEWTYAHRRRHAAPGQARQAPFHLGGDGIAFAGDGWGSARVETAWRSGTQPARALVASR